MFTIKGIITEISQGEKVNGITIRDAIGGKITSKLKFSPREIDIEEYQVGETITIVVEKEKTLFNKDD